MSVSFLGSVFTLNEYDSVVQLDAAGGTDRSDLVVAMEHSTCQAQRTAVLTLNGEVANSFGYDRTCRTGRNVNTGIALYDNVHRLAFGDVDGVHRTAVDIRIVQLNGRYATGGEVNLHIVIACAAGRNDTGGICLVVGSSATLSSCYYIAYDVNRCRSHRLHNLCANVEVLVRSIVICVECSCIAGSRNGNAADGSAICAGCCCRCLTLPSFSIKGHCGLNAENSAVCMGCSNLHGALVDSDLTGDEDLVGSLVPDGHFCALFNGDRTVGSIHNGHVAIAGAPSVTTGDDAQLAAANGDVTACRPDMSVSFLRVFTLYGNNSVVQIDIAGGTNRSDLVVAMEHSACQAQRTAVLTCDGHILSSIGHDRTCRTGRNVNAGIALYDDVQRMAVTACIGRVFTDKDTTGNGGAVQLNRRYTVQGEVYLHLVSFFTAAGSNVAGSICREVVDFTIFGGFHFLTANANDRGNPFACGKCCDRKQAYNHANCHQKT